MKVYTVEYVDAKDQSQVVMFVASTFDKAVDYCKRHALVELCDEHDYFGICCEVIDSEYVSSGSLIAKYAVTGLTDFRNEARDKGYNV